MSILLLLAFINFSIVVFVRISVIQMPDRVSQSELTEQIIVETAIIMLSSNEQDLTYGNEVSWTYIETHLGGENDRKACLHVLKQEARALTCLGADCIRIGSQGSKELCSLLRNTMQALAIFLPCSY